jgi:hypothetical protein
MSLKGKKYMRKATRGILSNKFLKMELYDI